MEFPNTEVGWTHFDTLNHNYSLWCKIILDST